MAFINEEGSDRDSNLHYFHCAVKRFIFKAWSADQSSNYFYYMIGVDCIFEEL